LHDQIFQKTTALKILKIVNKTDSTKLVKNENETICFENGAIFLRGEQVRQWRSGKIENKRKMDECGAE
jgi:hypothetical protein